MNRDEWARRLKEEAAGRVAGSLVQCRAGGRHGET